MYDLELDRKIQLTADKTDFDCALFERKLAEWESTLGRVVAFDIMDTVIDGISSALSELHLQIAGRDETVLGPLAHRLKGLCLNLDADRYGGASITELLENAVIAQDWLAVDLQYDRLKETIRALRQWCDGRKR